MSETVIDRLDRKYSERKRKPLFSYQQDREFIINGVRFLVPSGYWSDGATVPLPVRWLFNPAGKTFRPSVLHDWLYDTQGEGMRGYTLHSLTRKEVDRIFLAHMIEEGTPKLQAYLMYWAVRTPFGKAYWEDDSYPYKLLK
jgi:hypothetical protein